MTSQWQVRLQTDVLKRQWLPEWSCWIYQELHYIIAVKGCKRYIHFYHFDDWAEAEGLLKRIQAVIDFTPENKPTLWTRIQDCKPIVPKRKRNAFTKLSDFIR
jgi:hypothetical protein